MINGLDINIESLHFSMSDYDDEDKYFMPYKETVEEYKENLIVQFKMYQNRLKNELSKTNNITDIIKADVLLFYIYDMYLNCTEENVSDIVIEDEEEITSLWISHYLQELDDGYPKILKITY